MRKQDSPCFKAKQKLKKSSIKTHQHGQQKTKQNSCIQFESHENELNKFKLELKQLLLERDMIIKKKRLSL